MFRTDHLLTAYRPQQETVQSDAAFGAKNSNMTRIFDTDDYAETARKIFYKFELNQSCTILGWVDDEVQPKGELVLDEIKRLDKAENFVGRASGGKMIRKRKIEPDSIGDYVAGKIFKWKKVVITDTSELKYTIWRKQ